MNPAEARIRARLAEAGRITFAEYMATALYAPGGYYRSDRPRIGPDGDFYTSPTVHPAFGALVGGQVNEIWEQAGRPVPFEILELGSGRGTLAADMLLALREGAPACHAAVAYTVCDLEPPAEVPAAVAGKIAFRPAGEGLPARFKGVLIANEFLDALPVHRIQKLQGKLQELYVVDDGDRLLERPGPLSMPAAKLQELDVLPEGGIAEAPIAMVEWCRDLASSLDGGVALLIDYGGERADLLGRRAGSVRAYRRHRILLDPFQAIGEADITCHVDFSTLRDEAARCGLAILGQIGQAVFLQNLGMAGIQDALSGAPLDPGSRAANLAALQDLVDPAAFGSFQVLVLGGSDRFHLTGLTGDPPQQPLCAPILTRRHMALWGERAGDGGDVVPPGWDELRFRAQDLD